VCGVASRSDLIANTVVVVLTTLLLLGVVRLLLSVGEILILVLIAAILATGLSMPVEALHRRRWGRRERTLSRGLAVAAVYLGLLVVLGAAGSVLVTPVVTETREFIERAPALYEELQLLALQYQARYPWLPDVAAIIDRLPQEAGRITEYAGAATGVAFRVFGVLVSAITVLILSVYMVLEGPAMKAGALRFFPPSSHVLLEAILRGVGLKFGGWLRGQLLLGLIIGAAAGVGTGMLGLPYPLLLGLAAGITELIPMVGPVLGAIPAMLVALFGPWWRLVAVVALYTLIQQAENHFVVPRVMKISVGLSPLLTIIAIMVGAKLMGIVGALLAVPVAAALQVIAGEVLRIFRPSL
jgi:predicted PurR-regulated permease PerM